MAPAFFEMVEATDTGLVTTDPRFSGTWVSSNPSRSFIGHDGDHVISGLVHLQNDEGDWKGWTTGFSWMSEEPLNEQWWLVGEGAYEGLSAVVVARCDQLPCEDGDTALYGVIFEGDVPAQWEPWME